MCDYPADLWRMMERSIHPRASRMPEINVPCIDSAALLSLRNIIILLRVVQTTEKDGSYSYSTINIPSRRLRVIVSLHSP